MKKKNLPKFRPGDHLIAIRKYSVLPNIIISSVEENSFGKTFYTGQVVFVNKNICYRGDNKNSLTLNSEFVDEHFAIDLDYAINKMLGSVTDVVLEV